jgi:hypothetical protein
VAFILKKLFFCQGLLQPKKRVKRTKEFSDMRLCLDLSFEKYMSEKVGLC